MDTSLTTPPSATATDFTDATPSSTRIGAADVIYAETIHPVDSAPAVHWTLDGRAVPTLGNDRDLDLARFHLRSGTHRVTARIGTRTLTWTVDAQRPAVQATLPAVTRPPLRPHAIAFTNRASEPSL